MTNWMTRLRRRYVAAFVAGLAIVGVLGGGGAAVAAWTAQATGTGSVQTAAVAISQSNFPALQTTAINTLTRLASTGSFTVTNTGQVAGSAAVTIAGAGSLGPLLPTRIWPVTNAATECLPTTTPPTSAASGTWGATTVTTAVPLAPNESRTYCVRTQVTDRTALATATGTQSVTATLTATLSGTGWPPMTTTAAATLSTAAIYPLSNAPATTADGHWYSVRPATASNLCMDAASTGTTPGTVVLTYSCIDPSSTSPFTNRMWQLVPLDASGQRVTIRPAHAGAMRVGTNASEAVVLANQNAADPSQAWFVQTRGGGQVQFVNERTGKCLVLSPTSSASAVAKDCDGAGVAVTLTAAKPTIRSSSLSSFTVDVGWTVAIGSQQVQYLNGSTWQACHLVASQATVSGSATTATCNRPGTNATGSLRVVSGSETLVQFTVSRTSTGTTTITGVTP